MAVFAVPACISGFLDFEDEHWKIKGLSGRRSKLFFMAREPFLCLFLLENCFFLQKAAQCFFRTERSGKIAEKHTGKIRKFPGNTWTKAEKNRRTSRPQTGEVVQTGTIVRPARCSAFFLGIFCLKTAHCYYNGQTSHNRIHWHSLTQTKNEHEMTRAIIMYPWAGIASSQSAHGHVLHGIVTFCSSFLLLPSMLWVQRQAHYLADQSFQPTRVPSPMSVIALSRGSFPAFFLLGVKSPVPIHHTYSSMSTAGVPFDGASWLADVCWSMLIFPSVSYKDISGLKQVKNTFWGPRKPTKKVSTPGRRLQNATSAFVQCKSHCDSWRGGV